MLSSALLLVLLQHTKALSHTPPDHLVPPPLPQPQRLVHIRPESTRLHAVAAPAPVAAPSDIRPIPLAAAEDKPTENAGLMNRIARWFGYGNAQPNPQQQSLVPDQVKSASEQQGNGAKQAYYYAKPNQLQNSNKAGDNCYLCNKFPWVPMMVPSVPYNNVPQNFQQNQWAQASQLVEVQAGTGNHDNKEYPPKQRAVQFNFPQPNFYYAPNSLQQSLNIKQTNLPNHNLYNPPFLPIPVPNLSGSALPPLYSAQPFRPLTPAVTPASLIQQQHIQQLPSTETSHFAENQAAHSEHRPERVQFNNNRIVTKEPSFEIIKSQQVTDFVSSIEYPASIVKSQYIDVQTETTTLPPNHKPEEQNIVLDYKGNIFGANLSKHIPASQILTNINSFRVTTVPPDSEIPETTLYSNHKYADTTQEQQSGVQQNIILYDSSAAASSAQQQQQSLNEDWNGKNNEVFYATTTEYPLRFTSVEIFPSIQTNYIHQQYVDSNKLRQKNRDTPKRLLDSPIQHQEQAGAAKTFTRDPSNLNFRLPAHHSNVLEEQPTQQQAQETKQQILVTPLPAVSVTTSIAAAPTPTSTYSSLDASGQFAGMQPPAVVDPQASQKVQQIIIPYTTKNQPRPFEPTRIVDNSTPKLPWNHLNESQELHQHAASQLVKSTATPPARKTTKYLTKILASNLRDLLRKEHETKNKSKYTFDLLKFQKNIDDWTEQEYTSLSHRASTPTIRGRSKHIPVHYLTTTMPTPRQSKTTKHFDDSNLSTSINHQLEDLLIGNSKHLDSVPFIEDNRLPDFGITTTTEPYTTTTTTEKPTELTTITPLLEYFTSTEEPVEQWHKAKVSISPQTKEKVYVVTPQPLYFPQRAFPVKGEGFSKQTKSARFLVRPTPGYSK